MQAVANQTGVPPDTLRSWERRYGFPEPSRTDTNRRLYSERDIAAIAWLRDQTEQGQGISEAVHMLLSRLERTQDTLVASTPVLSPDPVPSADTPTTTGTSPHRDRMPDNILLASLRTGDNASAQRAWDQLALRLSPEALGTEILLPTAEVLRQASDQDAFNIRRAMAFLQRKATVLLDQAGPEGGTPAIALIAKDGDASVPATVLAALLARSGFDVLLPVERLSLATAATIRDSSPALAVLVATQPVPDATIDTCADALGRVPLAIWRPEAGDTGGPTMLPADPRVAVRELRRRFSEG